MIGWLQILEIGLAFMVADFITNVIIIPVLQFLVEIIQRRRKRSG